jgi:hypothetical protein
MCKRRVAVWMLIISLFSFEVVVAAQRSGQPLTNQDVISMVKNLLPESVILSAIKTNQADFDVSAIGLIALKKAGVPPKVMQAMLDVVYSKKNAAAAPAPAAATAIGGIPNVSGFTGGAATAMGGPGGAAVTPMGAVFGSQPMVSFVQGGLKVSLAAEATQIAQTKAKATSLAGLAADQALNETLRLGQEAAQQALLNKGAATAAATIGKVALGPGGMVLSGILARRKQMSKVTYVWALQGPTSSAQASSNTPSFDVNYTGIPGVNADAFEPVIVKLSPTPQANFRLVGATEAATTAEQSTQQDWPIYSSFVEDRVKAKVEKLGTGHAKVTSEVAMSAGEYAVALRPVDKSHKFSGEEVGKNQAEGLLFNYAWTFSVK